MLQRILIGLVALCMLVLLNSSCSKRTGIMDGHELVRGISPNPMLPDSLELDSLRKTGFR